jgi:hypothetical protein
MCSKILMRLIAATLLFGALVAGCGGNNQTSEATAPQAQDSAAAQKAAQEGAAKDAAINAQRAKQQPRQ